MKRTLLLVGVVVGLLAASPLAGAAVSDSESTQSLGIEGTAVTVEVPAHWENLGHYPRASNAALREGARKWLKQYPNVADVFGISDADFLKLARKDITRVRLLAADTNHDGVGDGDNLVATVYTDGQEFNSLAEWTSAQRVSAQSTQSTVLSDSQGLVGKHHTFTHVERYPDGEVFAAMEIDLAGKTYIDVAVLLDPGSEPVAQQILDSVHG